MELHLDTARSSARSALGYSQAFDGKGINWHNDEPWPHRMELAQALDWITDLGAMVLNLADRMEKAEAALLDCARKAEALKRDCGMDPESAQAVAAKPLEWDQDSGFQWTDKHHGFSIIEEPGDDLPFSAAWGEGDAEQFATLDEAKAWCQAQIDAYFGKHAVIAATTKATT